MSSPQTYLGFDLGAGSGRAVLGFFTSNLMRIQEIHRFSNHPIELAGSLYWDFLSLWDHIVKSLSICSQLGFKRLSGVGMATWGVDFGLMDQAGKLIGNPLCYRDASTEGVDHFIAKAIPHEEFYRTTGMTIHRVGSLPQLVAMNQSDSKSLFKSARTFLMIPDLFRYYLCGQRGVELTSAGSSLMTNIKTGKWSAKILRSLKVPTRLLPEIIQPATVVGKLRPDLAKKTGLQAAPIIAVAGHDTCSAAAALPIDEPDCAMLICGTWSVLGQLLPRPITSPAALKSGFVNELAMNGILFVKNLMGMYLFENLRRTWLDRGEKISYAQMVKEAQLAQAFKAMLHLNAPLFFVSDDPQVSIQTFLQKTGQKVRLTRAELIRSLLEGLAFSYRENIEHLEKLTGQTYRRIRMVGGAVRNRLLCQMVADATGLEVTAGLPEATVVGNLSVQALATGQIKTPEKVQETIRNSFVFKQYQPKSSALWNKQTARFKQLQQKSKSL